MDKLCQVMDGYRRSFEYIQDYININGLNGVHCAADSFVLPNEQHMKQ